MISLCDDTPTPTSARPRPLRQVLAKTRCKKKRLCIMGIWRSKFKTRRWRWMRIVVRRKDRKCWRWKKWLGWRKCLGLILQIRRGMNWMVAVLFKDERTGRTRCEGKRDDHLPSVYHALSQCSCAAMHDTLSNESEFSLWMACCFKKHRASLQPTRLAI